MEVKRYIHPIGQGGFYTETLSNGNQTKNFVYDCGGFNRNQTKMKDYLKSYLDKLDQETGKKEIEAVFISHFHSDHINGLQYLLENARVKYLVLPQLTEDVLIEAFVYNYCQTGTYNRVNRFLWYLNEVSKFENGEGPRPSIIQIAEADDSLLPEDFNSEIFDNEVFGLEAWNWRQNTRMDLTSLSIAPSSTVLHCGKWLYIPFNSTVEPGKREKLRRRLEKEFGENITINNLAELLKKKVGVQKCKNIYNDVFDNKHNGYSMTLFSGTTVKDSYRFKKGFEDYYCRYCHDYFCWCHHRCTRDCPYCWNPNFLYYGDFEPEHNIDKLMRFYNPVWNKIASIQVPHHGSKHNYDRKLYEYPFRGIVSVGNSNPYHHPDIDTMAKIQRLGCIPVFVTENQSTKRVYEYWG